MEHKKQQKNKRKFEKLFRDYSDVVYRLCLYKTSREDIAQDLTQETFLRVWKTMCSDKEIEKPKEYTYQIARNLIVDYYRKKKEISLEELNEVGFSPVTKESSPEIKLEVSILKKAIDSLEQDFRDVIYMRFVEGMKVQNIAHILGISENLVSVRISRGKQKLMEKFK